MKKWQNKPLVTFFGAEQGSQTARFVINHKAWSHADANEDATLSCKINSKTYHFDIEFMKATLVVIFPCTHTLSTHIFICMHSFFFLTFCFAMGSRKNRVSPPILPFPLTAPETYMLLQRVEVSYSPNHLLYRHR